MAQHPHLLQLDADTEDALRPALELLWRAAPEQVQELDRIFGSGAAVQYTLGQAPTLGAFDSTIIVSEGALRQLWLMTHAAWQEFVNFDDLKTGKISDAPGPVVLEALSTAKDIADRAATNWPSEIPQFREEKPGVEAKAIREIFAMACAWAIFHEFRHAQFHIEGERPAKPIDEELKCDEYALEMLFSMIDEYSKRTGEIASKVRAKRAIGSLFGLYYVARMSSEGSDTHPPVQDRIKKLFDRLDEEAAAQFWAVAVGILWGLRPSIATMQIHKENPSSQDLAFLALEGAFERTQT